MHCPHCASQLSTSVILDNIVVYVCIDCGPINKNLISMDKINGREISKKNQAERVSLKVTSTEKKETYIDFEKYVIMREAGKVSNISDYIDLCKENNNNHESINTTSKPDINVNIIELEMSGKLTKFSFKEDDLLKIYKKILGTGIFSQYERNRFFNIAKKVKNKIPLSDLDRGCITGLLKRILSFSDF